MADKRQRARVQGSWAKPGTTGAGAAGVAGLKQKSGTWRTGGLQFEFQQPQSPMRVVPVEKVIEEAGEYEISHSPTGTSRLRLFPAFVPCDQADWIFSTLLQELPWSQKINHGLKGEAYEEPRLTCWYGEFPYTYSRSTMSANPEWHHILTKLRRDIEQNISHTFNSLLCNLYRDGKDSISWHSDNEPSLGVHPTIASLSFGETRAFSLRKKPPPEDDGDYTYTERIKIPLTHGTLLIMDGCTQDDWQHQVAKEYHDRGPRINLTFRTIYPEPGPHFSN